MALDDEDLEGGLFEAFKAPAESVLANIGRLHGGVSSVLLREPGEEVAPVLVRRPGPGSVGDDSRYQVLGEIARGGIGLVFKCRDKDLNREVALKVLRPEYAEREDVVQRFVEEAQVGGQLQHPGIVPVYGIGLHEDGRPSFAMKLIKGQTLAELLDSNDRGVDLMTVYEQVVQTVAYAHSRGVIHRDLKPANVMVGAFGEVQVVDWGFAKILGHEDVPRAPDRTVIATLRSGPVGSQSIEGSVMGTPAYMPPEQAMGQIDDLDERSDVFALGAILLEVLTGQPPYTGEPRDQLIAAAQSRLDPALARLEAAGVHEDLDALVRACLDPLPSQRPRSARVVAERFGSYLAGAEERARQAEVDAVGAETEAVAAVRRRRRSVVRAAIALFLVAVGGGGVLLWKHDKDARESRAAPRIAAALREATRHEGAQAWAPAVEAAQRAASIAASEGVDDGGAARMLARLERERAEAEDAARIADEDDALLAELDAIRGRLGRASLAPRVVTRDFQASASASMAAEAHRAIDEAFERAIRSRFERFAEAAERMRSSPHAAAFAAHLHFWAWLRRTRPGVTGTDFELVARTAAQVDPSHAALRRAMLDGDREVLVAAAGSEAAVLPSALASQLGMALVDVGERRIALDYLQQQVRLHTDDFWLHAAAGDAAEALGEHRQAAGHREAAVALRPGHATAWHRLGRSLEASGDGEGAERAMIRATEVAPDSPVVWTWLGSLYTDTLARPEKALAAFAKAEALDPDSPGIQVNKGMALFAAGRMADATAQFERTVERFPQHPGGHLLLGSMRERDPERRDEARGCYERAIEIDPTSAEAEFRLASWWRWKPDGLDKVVEHARRAVELGKGRDRNHHLALAWALAANPDRAVAAKALREAMDAFPQQTSYAHRLALLLKDEGKRGEALTVLQQVLERHPRDPQTYVAFGSTQPPKVRSRDGKQVPSDRALEAFWTATKIDPEHANAWFNYGTALWQGDRYEAALAPLEKAVELDPQRPHHHCNLGLCYRSLGRWKDAARAIAAGRAIGLRTPRWPFANSSRGWLEVSERLAGMEDETPRSIRERLAYVLRGLEQPRAADEALVFARLVLAYGHGHYDDALRLYELADKGGAVAFGDPATGHRYNAACAAAAARAPAPAKALRWLRDDLAARRALLAEDPKAVADTLGWWKRDPDLASVRDADDLSDDWKRLWADVDALLADAKEAIK